MAITNISSVSVGDVVKCVDLKGITFPSLTEGNLYTVASVSRLKNLIGIKSDVGETVYYYAARRFDVVVYKMAVIDLEAHQEIKTNPQLAGFMNKYELACVLTFKGGKAGGLVVMRRSVASALPEEASVKGHMPSFPNNSWGHTASGDSTYIAGRLPDAFGGSWIYPSAIEAIVTHLKGFMKLVNIEPNKEEEDKKEIKKEAMITVKPGDIIVLKTLEEAKKENVNLSLNPNMNKYFDGKTQRTVNKVYGANYYYDDLNFSLEEIGGWLFSPSWVLKKFASKKEATIAKGGTYIELDLKDYPEVQAIEDLEVVLGDFEAAIIKHTHVRNDGGNLLVFKTSYLSNFDTLEGYVLDEIPELSPKWGHSGNGVLKFGSFSSDFRCWWIDEFGDGTTKDAKKLFSGLNLIPVEIKKDTMKSLFGVDATPLNLVPLEYLTDPFVDITSLHGEEFEKALFADGEQAVIVDFGKAVTGIDETAVVLIAHELLDKAEELGVEAYVMGEVIQATWGFDKPYVLEKTGILKGHCGKSETLGVCKGKSITPDAIETAREELDSLLSAVKKAEERKIKEEAEKVIEELPKPIIHRFYS